MIDILIFNIVKLDCDFNFCFLNVSALACRQVLGSKDPSHRSQLLSMSASATSACSRQGTWGNGDFHWGSDGFRWGGCDFEDFEDVGCWWLLMVVGWWSGQLRSISWCQAQCDCCSHYEVRRWVWMWSVGVFLRMLHMLGCLGAGHNHMFDTTSPSNL